MAQFDVYRNPNLSTNKEFPYLLDVQNDILKSLHTRVVVPLVTNQPKITHLTPSFIIEDIEVMMLTSQLAGVSIEILGEKVSNLENNRSEIISAIDFMLTGF